MVVVNPEILKWARETAGLELDDDAAKKLGFTEFRFESSAHMRNWNVLEKVATFRADPTVLEEQLNKMSKAYYQPPMSSIYLSSPPKIEADKERTFESATENN